MAWDRTKDGKRRGMTMRVTKPRSPQPWACSSFSSTEKFLPSFDNMMESWADRDSEKFESPMCIGCQGQVAPQDSSGPLRTQKPESNFVLPESIITRWSVAGKKVYCRTSIQSSTRWEETDSSQRVRMSMMFLNYYEHEPGNELLGGPQKITGNIFRDVRIQSGCLLTDSFLEQKPDLSEAKDHYRGLIFSLAGAAGMRLICPPLKLPILETLMFAYQQLSPKNRAKVLNERRLWRFPLNLAIATLRPFCGSVVRRCLTVFLCISQMRNKKNMPIPARSPPPDLYSVVQFETERLGHNQFTASCKQIRREDLVATQSFDKAERNSWNEGPVYRGVGERNAEMCGKCLPINGLSAGVAKCWESNNCPESRHWEGFRPSELYGGMEVKNRGYQSWTPERVNKFPLHRALNDGESLKRLRTTVDGPALPKRHCIHPISSLDRIGPPLYFVQCQAGTVDRAKNFDKMVQATRLMSIMKNKSDLISTKISTCPEESGSEYIGESQVFSNYTCVSDDRECYSKGMLPESRFESRDCDHSDYDDGYYYASMDNIPLMLSEESSDVDIGRNSRHCNSQFYSTGDSVSEKVEIGKLEMDHYECQDAYSSPRPKFISSKKESLENVEFNRASLDPDRSIDASGTCFIEHSEGMQRNSLGIGAFKEQSDIVGNDVFRVEPSPVKFKLESAPFRNGKLDNKQSDRFRSEQHRVSSPLEDELYRDISVTEETCSDDPFADHPLCIAQRMRRHSHGDQTYLDVKGLPAPWGQLIFWHGRCKEGRPTLCVLLGKAVRQLPSQDLKQFIAVTVSHMEYAELNFFKGPVKRMNILMDLEGLGFMRLPPLNILSSIGSVLNRDYPGRGGWIMLINAPMMLGLVVGTIQGIILRPSHNKGVPMDSSFRGFLEGNERVFMIGSKYRPVLQKYFEDGMLPTSLGGECTCNLDGVDCKRGLEFLAIT